MGTAWYAKYPLPRVYLVMALADGGVAIDEGVARWGSTVDVSPSRGHQYSNKAPGSSTLAVPAYVALRGATHLLAGREPTLGEMVWACRLWTGAIPTLLFLWLPKVLRERACQLGDATACPNRTEAAP